LVLEEVQEVVFQALLHDLQNLKDVSSTWKACYNAGLREYSAQVVSFWVHKVADDREYVVDEKAGSQKLRNAFLVRRELRSRSQDLIQARQNEEDNVKAEVAIRVKPEEVHPTLTISTLSCYCCQFSR
jgi:hypothetical protein